jgi:hypothetical protein
MKTFANGLYRCLRGPVGDWLVSTLFVIMTLCTVVLAASRCGCCSRPSRCADAGKTVLYACGDTGCDRLGTAGGAP